MKNISPRTLKKREVAMKLSKMILVLICMLFVNACAATNPVVVQKSLKGDDLAISFDWKKKRCVKKIRVSLEEKDGSVINSLEIDRLYSFARSRKLLGTMGDFGCIIYLKDVQKNITSPTVLRSKFMGCSDIGQYEMLVDVP